MKSFESYQDTRMDGTFRDENEDESENLLILWLLWQTRDNKSERM